MGVLSGLGDAEVTGRGAYLGLGNHVLEVKKYLFRPSKNPKKKGAEFVITEFTVIESTNETHKPGSTRSWTVNMQHQPALGNIKAFLLAIIPPLGWPGYTLELMQKFSNEAWDKLGDYLLGPENPLGAHKARVRAEGYNITTVEKGQDFTAFNWSPVEAKK